MKWINLKQSQPKCHYIPGDTRYGLIQSVVPLRRITDGYHGSFNVILVHPNKEGQQEWGNLTNGEWEWLNPSNDDIEQECFLKMIDYIKNDSECAIPIDKFTNENGTPITKKQYGLILLETLCEELKTKFIK